MRYIMTIALLVALVTCQPIIGKSKLRTKVQPREYVSDLNKRPDLGVNYSRVARFKLGSRKTTYHVGEMITIELAIMNAGNTPVFFHEPFPPSVALDAVDENGTRVSVNRYAIAFEAISPKSYRRTEPGRLMLASFQLLAGCSSDNLDSFLEQKNKLDREESTIGTREYLKRVFEHSLFVRWGEACFARSPGKYTITAEESNDAVLLSSDNKKVKTAVGRIRSSPLTVTIID